MRRLTLVLALLAVPGMAPAQAKDEALPEGPGLARLHPGDRGIETHEAVSLAERFEQGTVADLGKRFSEVKNPGGEALAFVDDAPAGADGTRCLQITGTIGKDTGGHCYTSFDGVDTLFVRFYVKFMDREPIHHFVTMGGYRPRTRWPQGHAGTKPAGHERFTVAIEPHATRKGIPLPGRWSFYTYWNEMKGSADGKHWGNGLLPQADQAVPHDRWQCVEVMVRLNSKPERRDGELALWLDGAPVAHFKQGARRSPWSGMGFRLLDKGGAPFEGFRWRTHPDLEANFVVLSLYVTDRAMRRAGVREPKGRTVRVRFDHLVVATQYIGPLAKAEGR